MNGYLSGYKPFGGSLTHQAYATTGTAVSSIPAPASHDYYSTNQLPPPANSYYAATTPTNNNNLRGSPSVDQSVNATALPSPYTAAQAPPQTQQSYSYQPSYAAPHDYSAVSDPRRLPDAATATTQGLASTGSNVNGGGMSNTQRGQVNFNYGYGSYANASSW